MPAQACNTSTLEDDARGLEFGASVGYIARFCFRISKRKNCSGRPQELEISLNTNTIAELTILPHTDIFFYTIRYFSSVSKFLKLLHEHKGTISNWFFFPQSSPNGDHELNLVDGNIAWIRLKFSHSERNRDDLCSSNSFDKQRPCMMSTSTKNIKQSWSLLKIPFSVNQPIISPARRNGWSDTGYHTALLFWKCM